MVGGPFVIYSEVTGVTPTEADIERLLQPLDPRKALFLLSRMNMHFRLVRSSEGITFEQAIGNAQVFLFQAFTDEGLFEQIKIALGNTNAHERVLFHPLQILNVMCLALKYCKGTDDAKNVTDEMRNAVGRCCLMMNDLLTKEDETLGLSQGSDNFRTAQAMAHLLPVFEVNNPGDMIHLLNRSLVMFNLLMSDTPTRNEILNRTGNYDFPRRFLELTGVELERWIAILFCCIAFHSQYDANNGEQYDHKYLWIDPRAWVGASQIPENDLRIVLGLTSKRIDELASAVEDASLVSRNANIKPFKFHPLLKIGYLFVCTDYGFLVEKLFAGAYWALHNCEDDKGRKRLSSAWGILFERYVNWWAQGRNFQTPMIYHPFPVWNRSPAGKSKGAGEEAFDAVILQETKFMALEYKGGFLALDAKYSKNLRLLLRDLNRKIAKGCKQLAKNIEELFGIVPGRNLQNIPTQHVTRVIPVIVVQDQSLRSWGVDWWIRRQFRRAMRRAVLRPGVTVEPVTLIHINEFETMIDSAEGLDFGLFEAIQLRNFRDQDGMSDLTDVLLKHKGYGTQHSTRRKELEAEFDRCVLKYAFPGEYKSK